MEITPQVCFVVAGLRCEGLKVSKGAIEEFNEVEFYRSCLQNPNVEIRSFGVGKLAMNPCILLLNRVDSHTKGQQSHNLDK